MGQRFCSAAAEKAWFRGFIQFLFRCHSGKLFLQAGIFSSAGSRQTAQCDCVERLACVPFSSKTGLYVQWSSPNKQQVGLKKLSGKSQWLTHWGVSRECAGGPSSLRQPGHSSSPGKAGKGKVGENLGMGSQPLRFRQMAKVGIFVCSSLFSPRCLSVWNSQGSAKSPL